MKYPDDDMILEKWKKYMEAKKERESVQHQVMEVVEELYGLPEGVTEEEVHEFCDLKNFRKYMRTGMKETVH